MIRHVLLDADGVLQHLPGGWLAALRPYLGEHVERFVQETNLDEEACLTGERDFLPLLAGHLERYGVTTPAPEVYAGIWHDIHVEESSLALVRDLRGLGLGVHLATNQEAGRGAYMRDALGYDELFDESFYSCDVGVAKPDAAFFTTAVDRLGVTPPEMLFVDDHEPNVAGAREVGLAAEHWRIADGTTRLHALLAGHGILFPGA